MRLDIRRNQYPMTAVLEKGSYENSFAIVSGIG